MGYLHRALYTFQEIAAHPLTRDDRARAVGRWMAWQIGSRLVGGPVAIPLTDRARLLVGAGMHGATMNIFTGLADFEEMGFVLHYLRPSDLFVDVGANVGAFGVLAGAAAEARVMLFEPGEKAFGALVANVRLNGLESRTKIIRKAASDHVGKVSFTQSLDTLNHVLEGGDAAEGNVDATTLDDELAGESPALMKIDVEGFERSVIRGAPQTLGNPALGAVIMELGSHSRRYGVDPRETFAEMLKFGFVPVIYDPLQRALIEQPRPFELDETRSDTIFVRDVSSARERLRGGRAFTIFGRTV